MADTPSDLSEWIGHFITAVVIMLGWGVSIGQTKKGDEVQSEKLRDHDKKFTDFEKKYDSKIKDIEARFVDMNGNQQLVTHPSLNAICHDRQQPILIEIRHTAEALKGSPSKKGDEKFLK